MQCTYPPFGPLSHLWIKQIVSQRVVLAGSGRWPQKRRSFWTRNWTRATYLWRFIISALELISNCLPGKLQIRAFVEIYFMNVPPLLVLLPFWDLILSFPFSLCLCVCGSRPALRHDGGEGSSCYDLASLWRRGVSEPWGTAASGGTHSASREGHLDQTTKKNQITLTTIKT